MAINGIELEVKCSGCGKMRSISLSYDQQAESWTAPSYCKECQRENPIRSLVYKRVEPSKELIGDIE